MATKLITEADGPITSVVVIAGKLYAFTATSIYRVKTARNRHRDSRKSADCRIAKLKLVKNEIAGRGNS